MSWDTELPEELKQYEKQINTMREYIDFSYEDTKPSLFDALADIFDEELAIEILGHFARESSHGEPYSSVLAEFGNERAVEILKDLVTNGNLYQRKFSVEPLVKSGGEEVIDFIDKLTCDDSWVVRLYTAEALSKIGSSEAKKVLYRFQDDKKPCVRSVAKEALN